VQQAPAAPKQPEKPPQKPVQPGKPDAVEIDLSDMLTDFKVGEAPVAPVASVFDDEPAPLVPDLDEVFELFRDEAERASGGRSDYDRGVQLREAGRIDESIQAFEAAARLPRYRFDASAALGRIHRDRGAPLLALDWFERATHAPAADPGDAHELFYELADLLESIGEIERALAICLELQADAGEYRDLSARIQRLTKVQARG
jgi:tetratricopeptide (TPR) repeat protein